jgi:2,4-dienoyl-CoA reductase-like NADH-dependent reductase (Old Yellow Enzyme family)
MSTSALFSPLRVRDVEFGNRLWVAPMCQYSVLEEDGVPREWHRMHLGSLAVGGAGLVIVEATAVSPEGRITARDTGLWNDEQRDAFAAITAFAHEHGTRIGVQLAHAGRKASTFAPWGADGRGTVPLDRGGWQTVAPSDIPFGRYERPRALDAAGIDGVVDDFRSAARRSVAAGFDVLEIHAAHGYLLHQFLSPLSNLREDEYGGSLENRARLLLRIVREVRAEVGEGVPLFVRFSATDWAVGGWDEEQTAVVARWCADAGADFFDVSSGGNVADATIPLEPGYQVPFAASIRSAATVPTSAVGLITEAEHAERIVASGEADAVMIARQALRNPHWPLLAAQALGADVAWPGQYERAAR